MKDLKRIERIMYKIGKLWTHFPKQRLFQLLFNYTQLGTRDKVGTVRDPFYYDDSAVEAYLDVQLKDLEKKKR